MDVNKKCQVFTPKEIVQQLLNKVGYINNLYGKKVAENSCGDGSILSEIVIRYINDCIKANIPNSLIKSGLEQDIYAAEIDEVHIKNCKEKLNTISHSYNIFDVKWNIYNGDFLKQDITYTFDFVIGNPPYISYLELSTDIRLYLQETFSVCQHGKFDYCYAFIEAGVNSLTSTGKLAYVIPSNIFKNQFASVLRNLMIDNLTDIYDYTSLKLFEKKLTASAVIIYDSASNQNTLTYHDIVNKKQHKIKKATLREKWQFKKTNSNKKTSQLIRFGDVFQAASSIATLLNEVYIIDKFEEELDFLIVDGLRIERQLLKKAVSPRSLNYDKTEYIIFPYYYEHNMLRRYNADEFKDTFPSGVCYLKQFEDKLAKRDSDKGINWFEFGRSQALSHLNQKKLLVSTLITKKVKVYELDEYTIPTSGLYIVQKQEYGLDIAERVLKSLDFLEYVKNIGVISNANSFRISPKDINNYVFNLENF